MIISLLSFYSPSLLTLFSALFEYCFHCMRTQGSWHETWNAHSSFCHSWKETLRCSLTWTAPANLQSHANSILKMVLRTCVKWIFVNAIRNKCKWEGVIVDGCSSKVSWTSYWKILVLIIYIKFWVYWVLNWYIVLWVLIIELRDVHKWTLIFMRVFLRKLFVLFILIFSKHQSW
jgi:hypothetical protein